jgi:hypothetical protein
MPDTLAQSFLAEAARVLQHNHRKIRHCLDQLTDDHLNWRPFEAQNSVANIILHLCGNLTQWIVAGVSGTVDTRNRPAEFADRDRYTKVDLIARLDQVIVQVQQTLERAAGDARATRAAADQLLTPIRIQASEQTPLTAIMHATAHFEGHTHEIVYITRYLIRENYRFCFIPKSKEEGAP